MDRPPSSEPTRKPAPPGRWRLVALAAVLAALYAAGRLTGATDHLDVATVQQAARNAGLLGAALFVVAFAAGTAVQVPGSLFAAAGVLAYGKTLGFVVNLAGGSVAVCLTFTLVRLIGGRALGEVKRPIVRRLLERLDQRPIRWMFVLRTFAFVSPPLNYTLALTNVRFRDFAIGSTLGLVLPMAVFSLVIDWLLHTPFISRLLFG